MADLLQLSPNASGSFDFAPELSAATPEVVLPLLDEAVINQTVLRLTDAARRFPPENFADAEANHLKQEQESPRSISVARVMAMQQLVEALSQHQTLENSQALENLLPHVLNQAQDVLATLQADAISDREALEEFPEIPEPPHWQNLSWFKTLTPWLLWGTARSAYEVMRLMEGIPAQVLQPGQQWETGILRLIALLDVKTPEISQNFDLATHQASPVTLSPASLVQFDHTFDRAFEQSDLCQQPTSVAELTQVLTQQIQATTPAIAPFLEGVHTEILVPLHNWQRGLVQLHIQFEFFSTPSEPTWTGDSHRVADVPAIQFTDTEWLEQYKAIVFRQELAGLLPQFPRFQAIEDLIGSPSMEQSLLLLVKDADAIAHQLQHSLTLASRNFVQQQVGFRDLAFRLLWSLSRSAYEVMQLMSGVRASLLEPQDTWATGTLRFWVGVGLQTPMEDWYLDLVTGQPLELCRSLPADAIVQANDSLWCQLPTLLGHLEARIQQQINQIAPEIQLMMAGAEIDLMGSDQQWQPGVLRLSVGFEFIPDIDLYN